MEVPGFIFVHKTNEDIAEKQWENNERSPIEGDCVCVGVCVICGTTAVCGLVYTAEMYAWLLVPNKGYQMSFTIVRNHTIWGGGGGVLCDALLNKKKLKLKWSRKNYMTKTKANFLRNSSEYGLFELYSLAVRLNER